MTLFLLFSLSLLVSQVHEILTNPLGVAYAVNEEEEMKNCPKNDVPRDGISSKYHFAYSLQKQQAIMDEAYSLLEKANSNSSPTTGIREADDDDNNNTLHRP